MERIATYYNHDYNESGEYLEYLLKNFNKEDWTRIETRVSIYPDFRYNDTKNGYTVTLSCEWNTKEYIEYRFDATNQDGAIQFGESAWASTVNPESSKSKLVQLYETLYDGNPAEAKKDDNNNDAEEFTPEKDDLLTRNFLSALLKDAQSKTPKIEYEPRENGGFICRNFGESNCQITLNKSKTESGDAWYTFCFMTEDETPIAGVAEVQDMDGPKSSLSRLYDCVSERMPAFKGDTVKEEVERFIENQTYDTYFDYVAEHAIKTTHTMSEPKDNWVLISDIFHATPAAVIVEQFMEQLEKRKGPLLDTEHERIRKLAESTVIAIYNTKRAPNGFVFKRRLTSISYDVNNVISRTVRFDSNISRIANAWTTWPTDLFGTNPMMDQNTLMMRCAILLLAAILSDEI